jgi:hypothetical protein
MRHALRVVVVVVVVVGSATEIAHEEGTARCQPRPGHRSPPTPVHPFAAELAGYARRRGRLRRTELARRTIASDTSPCVPNFTREHPISGVPPPRSSSMLGDLTMQPDKPSG